MAETVYVLTNLAMPGLIKIGCTTREDLITRIKELDGTGVPLPFDLFYACEVVNALDVERKVHDAFDDHRVRKTREFFRLAPERAKAALSIGAVREIRLDENTYQPPEDKADVEAAKRRARFRLSMLGLKPGTELRLFKEPSITCVTADEVNHVDFHGERMTLSEFALRALGEVGVDWPTASGPWEWSYQGKRLDDLRREVEDNAD